MKESESVKLRAGTYYVPASLCPYVTDKGESRILIQSGYDKTLLEEIKAMEGAKYHGFPEADPPQGKHWSVPDTLRNQFALDYMRKDRPDPYGPYLQAKKVIKRYLDNKLAPIEELFEGVPFIDPGPAKKNNVVHSLYKQQIIMFNVAMLVKGCLWAAEMRTGKTLSAIKVIEHMKTDNVLYVCPKGAMPGVKVEFIQRGIKIPEMITYNELVRRAQTWVSGTIAPQILIFDECHMLKTANSERSKAALAFANGVRSDHPLNGKVIAMTGTPAPKNPTDWWSEIEVVCPGYIREGNQNKFTNRLALIEWVDTGAGGPKFPQRTTWFDNPKKCKMCGILHELHPSYDHAFVPSINEVANLSNRILGAVTPIFKKDVIDLPDLLFEKRIVEPTPSTLRAMSMILKTSSGAAMALTRCRELSDGFLYADEPNGEMEVCGKCHGNKVCKQFDRVADPEVQRTEDQFNFAPAEYVEEFKECFKCKGTGLVPTIVRVAKEVPCPKDEVVEDLLEEHSEIGRLVFYSGFQASVDRLTKLILKNGWAVIQADGRGWKYYGCHFNSREDALMGFANPDNGLKLAFNGHPEATGLGISLSASPTICFFSNTFKASDRMQAVHRIHDPGMDQNRGATIIDIIHLPTDLKVIENLDQKKDLQSMTLGEITDGLAY